MPMEGRKKKLLDEKKEKKRKGEALIPTAFGFPHGGDVL